MRDSKRTVLNPPTSTPLAVPVCETCVAGRLPPTNVPHEHPGNLNKAIPIFAYAIRPESKDSGQCMICGMAYDLKTMSDRLERHLLGHFDTAPDPVDANPLARGIAGPATPADPIDTGERGDGAKVEKTRPPPARRSPPPAAITGSKPPRKPPTRGPSGSPPKRIRREFTDKDGRHRVNLRLPRELLDRKKELGAPLSEFLRSAWEKRGKDELPQSDPGQSVVQTCTWLTPKDCDALEIYEKERWPKFSFDRWGTAAFREKLGVN